MSSKHLIGDNLHAGSSQTFFGVLVYMKCQKVFSWTNKLRRQSAVNVKIRNLF